ncbi:hypothetical protein GCM10010104_24640 [Streptomyces indiaensis]|uniref:Uncharacterized protein n=1 Tax=Streptomyces indiaensis TaxID=284033 RepID=A0ABN3DGX2_9ACTN
MHPLRGQTVQEDGAAGTLACASNFCCFCAGHAACPAAVLPPLAESARTRKEPVALPAGGSRAGAGPRIPRTAEGQATGVAHPAAGRGQLAADVLGHLAAVVALLPTLGLLVQQLTATAHGSSTGPARAPAPEPAGHGESQR